MKKGFDIEMLYDVTIIGAGASGMMSGIIASGNGKKVIIIEHREQPGKKILATGNGRCNYSNINQLADNYHCKNKDFVEDVLNQFSQKEMTKFLNENGMLTKEKNGYLYPRSNQAASIRDFLVSLLEKNGVRIMLNTECSDIKKDDDIFNVVCSGNIIKSRSVIVSTGGMTYKKTGSDGSGYKLLEKMGHTIIPPLPALTALYCKEKIFKELKGIRLDGKIELYVDDTKVSEDTGEIQLTDYGVSGIPVFQVSRFAAISLYQKRKVTASVDFLPEIDKKKLNELLYGNDLNIRQKLYGMVNKKLADVILKHTGIDGNMSIYDVKNKQLKILTDTLKNLHITVYATGDYEHAQVVTGGVDINEIHSNTMESKKIKNLYLTGEVMDVDGLCGGYNLQWAWSTGYIAGTNC